MSEFRGIEITTRMSNTTQEKDDGPVVILDFEWMANLKKNVKMTPVKDVHVQRATIFRVPDNFRASDPYGKAYDPNIISLGPFHHHPFHHHDDRLRVWNKRLKWPYLKKFLERSPDPDETEAMEKCIKKIKEHEREVRSEYEEVVKMTSNEFVEMMLLDCYFVLELLLEQAKRIKGENGKSSFPKR